MFISGRSATPSFGSPEAAEQKDSTRWRRSALSVSAIWARRWRPISSRPGTKGAASILRRAEAGGDIVIPMLPAGADVRSAYLGDAGVLAHAGKEALLIDCSTIDVETA